MISLSITFKWHVQTITPKRKPNSKKFAVEIVPFCSDRERNQQFLITYPLHLPPLPGAAADCCHYMYDQRRGGQDCARRKMQIYNIDCWHGGCNNSDIMYGSQLVNDLGPGWYGVDSGLGTISNKYIVSEF